MSLENIDLNKGLSRQELRELFQAKIQDAVSSKVDVTSYTLQQLENMLGGVGEVGTLLQRGIDYLRENPHSRRTFLKVTAESATITLAGLVYGFSPKEADAMGCAYGLIETPEAVANIKWDANPAIPVPKNGCYAGWHKDLESLGEGDFIQLFNTERVRLFEEDLIDYYIKDYGQGPAVHSFSDRNITGDFFPSKFCEGAYNKGVIPLIRYYFFPDFENVAKGKYDEMLKEFAQGAKEFGKPFFFVPYPEVNIDSRFKHVHPWAGSGGKGFKEAWARMHNIFEEIGANKYAVWGLHLIGIDAGQSFSKFALDKNLFDWIGFTEYNLERQSGGLDRSLRELLGLQDDYWWAQTKYPEKPIAFWEFGTSDTSTQGRWIKDAYKTIKKLPRIKLVVYAEYPTFGSGVVGGPSESTVLTDRAKPDYKKAISDPYFIGSKKL